MKSRDTLIRLKRFQLEEKRRRVRQIEMMLAEFTRMTAELDREIANEEKRAGIADPRHFAYPTYARAASVRRDNLKSSIARACRSDRGGQGRAGRSAGGTPEGRGDRNPRQDRRASDRRPRARLRSPRRSGAAATAIASRHRVEPDLWPRCGRNVDALWLARRCDDRPSSSLAEDARLKGSRPGKRRRSWGKFMLIGVPAETDPAETRVAASPETVKKFIGLGAEVAVEHGAGLKAGRRRRRLSGGWRAARLGGGGARRGSRSEGPAADRTRTRSHEERRARHRHDGPLRPSGRDRGDGEGGRLGLRDGIDAAHHPRAGDGRPLEPGEPCRIPRRDRRGGRIRPRDADDDDAGGHGPGRQAVRHGRRRRGPAGDRDRPSTRRDRHRDRRPSRDQGAGRVARREIRRRRRRGIQAGRDRRRLRQGNVGRL